MRVSDSAFSSSGNLDALPDHGPLGHGPKSSRFIKSETRTCLKGECAWVGACHNQHGHLYSKNMGHNADIHCYHLAERSWGPNITVRKLKDCKSYFFFFF